MDALRQSVEASGAGKKPLLSGDIKIARSPNANENEGTVPPNWRVFSTITSKSGTGDNSARRFAQITRRFVEWILAEGWRRCRIFRKSFQPQLTDVIASRLS